MGLELSHILNSALNRHRPLVILCIGTDRSTGDSLGPLIGRNLSKYRFNNVFIYGTLSEPVHAVNITAVTDNIYDQFDNPLVLAVDASLGKRDHVGFYTLAEGPLIPGLGVNRSLPPVGDIHITGIVNYSGLFDSMLLHTTRLSDVMSLADTISAGISIGIRHCKYAAIENYA
jgi:putative sporulation protein YyaC